MRDPTSLNKPSTREIGAVNMIGSIPGAAESLGGHTGLDSPRRHRRERRAAAAAAGLAGRLCPGARGHDLRHGAGERLALRPLRLLARKGCLRMADPGAIGYWTV